MQIAKWSDLCGDNDLNEIPVQMLSGVFDPWIETLHECIINDGDYL
jgi:hypothetical protein